jgi:hypothetical protein
MATGENAEIREGGKVQMPIMRKEDAVNEEQEMENDWKS